MINRIDGFVEEKNDNKYLNIADTARNNEILKNTIKCLMGLNIMSKINENGGEYDKDYMKIKVNTDDDIILNKQLNFVTITVIVRCVSEKNDVHYPQVYLDDCLYQV